MKKELIILTLLFLHSCNPKEYDFKLDNKWVLLTTEINNEDIKDRIIHNQLLSFTIRDKKFYPAIRFNNSDSTVLVPGTNNTKEILYYSTDQSFSNLKFYKKENSTEKSFLDSLFVNSFTIKKDNRNGDVILKSENIKIRMMPAERFANRIKASELD
ncbi:hypothetical protein ACNI3T_00385 [Christiangramia sp. ASW11-125]|uniref:hypothetical protein n=1 Tax=Christiangramia sp. ASW11-125 TaxID=3400701 RepID=UPI003AAB5F81